MEIIPELTFYSNICEMLIAEGNDIANFRSMPQLVVNNHIEDSNE